MKQLLAMAAIAMPATTAGDPRPAPTTPITGYAASPLIKSFTAIADGAHPDVFAAADLNNMAAAPNAGPVSGTPVPFAANRLVVVTPAANDKHPPREFGDHADALVAGKFVQEVTGPVGTRILAEDGFTGPLKN